MIAVHSYLRFFIPSRAFLHQEGKKEGEFFLSVARKVFMHMSRLHLWEQGAVCFCLVCCFFSCLRSSFLCVCFCLNAGRYRLAKGKVICVALIVGCQSFSVLEQSYFVLIFRARARIPLGHVFWRMLCWFVGLRFVGLLFC